MIQKKICMLGSFSVGKTSLVRRFVTSEFNEKYHTSIGVKVDKKIFRVQDQDVTLVLWDIYGEDAFQKLQMSYLRGMSGYFMVADGTRRQTVDVALALARWFVASGGVRDGRGRMAAHIANGATLPDAMAANAKPSPAVVLPRPGLYAAGALVGLAFGQMRSETLGYLADLAPGLRMTPWRMMLVA